MIPLGSASLSDVVTDLDLTTANANLNDVHVRNRVGKYSGAISVDDLRGSIACTQGQILPNWDAIPPRYINAKSYYDPLGNEYTSAVEMVSDGNASQGISLYAEHASQGGGDFNVASVHTGIIPSGLSGWVRMSGTLECDFIPGPVGFLRTEVILWDGGYYVGSPHYLLSQDWPDQIGDLSSVPMQFLSSPSARYMTITHQAIIKSLAPDSDYSSGKLYNFTVRITSS